MNQKLLNVVILQNLEALPQPIMTFCILLQVATVVSEILFEFFTPACVLRLSFFAIPRLSWAVSGEI